jgi:glycosyltransferase involved in cell wall biosynthesis
MSERLTSIFREYYADKSFVDRFAVEPAMGVDVIIPVIHTNELWEANLLSFYREIPIHKLLIGDDGCIDDSISIAEKFPRVQIFDHRNYQSLGYSIRKLIEAVETDWFVYLHSDAYLPPGWFDAMQKHQNEYDWFGCPMQHTVMVEYNVGYGERPWAGSQMGRKKAFESGLNRIDDDYVYRQEDFVFADIVQKAGFKEGKVTDTFHYHQTMYKSTPWARKVRAVKIDVELSREEEVRTWMMQGKGIVKYLQPSNTWLITDAIVSADYLISNKELTWGEFQQWVRQTNPKWLPHIRRGLFKKRLENLIWSFARSVGRFLFR